MGISPIKMNLTLYGQSSFQFDKDEHKEIVMFHKKQKILNYRQVGVSI